MACKVAFAVLKPNACTVVMMGAMHLVCIWFVHFRSWTCEIAIVQVQQIRTLMHVGVGHIIAGRCDFCKMNIVIW